MFSILYYRKERKRKKWEMDTDYVFEDSEWKLINHSPITVDTSTLTA